MKVDFCGEYFEAEKLEYDSFSENYDAVDLPDIDYYTFLKLVRVSFGKRDYRINNIKVAAHKDRYVVHFNYFGTYLVVWKVPAAVDYQCQQTTWSWIVDRVKQFNVDTSDDFRE